MIILIIIIILNFLIIIIIIILLITMLTILLTTISLKNTIPSKHYLQFLSIKKHLVLIRKKKLKHIKLLIIHFIILLLIIIIITIYSSQGTVGNIRWSPTANSNMIHAHGILQIALKTSFVLCQPTNAAAHRDKCVTPLVIYSTTR